MEFTVKQSGLPIGSYSATFTAIEPYEENLAQFDPGVSLRFRVNGGQFDGQEATRICSANLSPNSNLGHFAVALKGAAIHPDETFNFANYIGVSGSIIVKETKNGGTRVDTFLKAQSE